MGVALYVALEREVPGIDAASVDGKMLAAASEELDVLCAKLGVPTLSSFISSSPEEMANLVGEAPPFSTTEANEAMEQLRATGSMDEQELAELEELLQQAEDASTGNAQPPREQWFEPESGLHTVRACLVALRDQSTQLTASQRLRSGTIEDLEQIEMVLVAAASKHVRFHLAFDF